VLPAAIIVMAVYWLALLSLALQSACSGATPLDDYVHKADPSYEFRDLKIPVRMDGYTVHFLNMTSQTWLSCKLELEIPAVRLLSARISTSW